MRGNPSSVARAVGLRPPLTPCRGEMGGPPQRPRRAVLVPAKDPPDGAPGCRRLEEGDGIRCDLLFPDQVMDGVMAPTS